ncbi:MAG: M64 family metallo-endopeptidase [Planctomycetota bacterium]|nr:M64 family metallo-endopeptidase [Planctomycetota bacterium]
MNVFSMPCRFVNCLLLGMIVTLSLFGVSNAQEDSASESAQQEFRTWFSDGGLRLEFIQTGDASTSIVALQEMHAEPYWAENPAMLNPSFNYGRMRATLFDEASNKLICTRRFDTMFAEYAMTTPAREGVNRAYEITVRIPMPKLRVRIVLEERNSRNEYRQVFETRIDPTDYHIHRDSVTSHDVVFSLDEPGAPSTHVDIVFLSEGYTDEELPKFRADVRRMADFLFSQHPYSDLKDRISIRAVFRASMESGADEPRKRQYRSTSLNSSFNIFDLDRYLLIEGNHAMHQMASQVPYDTIVVLVNTERYGGGGICLDYCVCTTGHAASPVVFLHEFGHSFANLADEYTGDVSYSDVYPEGIEPLDPNITRQLDRDKIKWKAHLTPNVALPTPPSDDKTERHMQIVGAFEGGGYLQKGMYRPQQFCWMGTPDPEAGFCVVCREAIREMIDLQTGQTEIEPIASGF